MPRKRSKQNGTAGKYLAKPGSKISNEAAQVVGETLEEMAGKDIGITPANLVAIAEKRQTSPIGRLFEWDDRKAAHLYRLKWATKLIQSVMILVINGDEHRVRGFHSIKIGTDDDESETRCYASHEEVMADRSMLDQVSRDTYARLLAIAESAADIGLMKTDPAWRALVMTVRSNRPRATLIQGNAEEVA